MLPVDKEEKDGLPSSVALRLSMTARPDPVIDIDMPRDKEAIVDRPNDVSIFWKMAGRETDSVA